MARLRPSHLLALMFAAIVAVDAQDITVGFVETSYTVTEGGSLEICAEVKEPDDIGEDTLDIEVDPDGDSSLIPGGADNEATPDTINLFGEYAMMPGADYAPPLPSAADQFPDITQSRRVVCYTLNTYSDDDEEGDKYISLRLIQRGDPAVVFNPMHTLVRIVDDYLTTTPPPVSECPSLENPANGMVELSGVTPGSTATYTCDSGFELSGTAILNCGSEGTWDPLPPTCMQITCPNLPQPDNGQIQYVGFLPGQQAFVTCEGGFVISGEGVLNCQDTGLWDLAPGVCEARECPPLENPTNGTVEVSGLTPGNTATYACHDVYVLIGIPVLNCGSEGAWDRPQPTCRRNFTCYESTDCRGVRVKTELPLRGECCGGRGLSFTLNNSDTCQNCFSMEEFCSDGSEFYLAFFSNQDVPPFFPPGTTTVRANNMEDFPQTVTATYKSGEMEIQLGPKSSGDFALTDEIRIKDSNESDKGVFIQSKEGARLSLTAFGSEFSSSDTFKVLPTVYLPANYEFYAISVAKDNRIIDGEPPNINTKSVVVFIATEANTVVTVTPSQDVTIVPETTTLAGTPLTLTLDQRETVFIASIEDLTGTHVISDKPLSYFSGHECGNMPSDMLFCDHMVEQIPPTATWGTEFYSASFMTRPRDIYRVLSATDSNSLSWVCTSTNDGSTVTTANEMDLPTAGVVIEFEIPQNEFCRFTSPFPVLLVQFSVGGGQEIVADPSMTIIPPVKQYKSSYILNYFPGTRRLTNFVNIILLNHEGVQTNSTLLDGSIVSGSWTDIFCEEGSTDICAFGIQVNMESMENGAVTLSHSIPNAQMVGIQYSTDVRTSRATFGGMTQKPIALDKVSLSDSAYYVTGESEVVIITITRFGKLLGSVNISLRAHEMAGAENTARADEDFIAINTSIIFPPGEPIVTVSVTLGPFSISPGEGKVFEVYLGPAQGVFVSPIAYANVTIIDPGCSVAVNVTFSQTEYSIREGSGYVELTLVKSACGIGPVTVTLSSLPGTAVAFADFELNKTNVTFRAKERVKVVKVAITDDDILEGDESFSVMIQTVAGQFPANVTGSLTTIKISDNDVLVLGLQTGSPLVNETVKVVDINLKVLRGGVDRELEVQVFTASGSATRGQDFVDITRDIFITPSTTKVPLSVEIIDDAVCEGKETFTLLILTLDRRVVALDNLNIAISDDDCCPEVWMTVTPTTASEAGGRVKVTVVVDGVDILGVIRLRVSTVPITAESDVDYETLKEGEVAFTSNGAWEITVGVHDNDVYDGPEPRTFAVILSLLETDFEKVNISISRVVVSITDDEAQPSLNEGMPCHVHGSVIPTLSSIDCCVNERGISYETSRFTIPCIVIGFEEEVYNVSGSKGSHQFNLRVVQGLLARDLSLTITATPITAATSDFTVLNPWVTLMVNGIETVRVAVRMEPGQSKELREEFMLEIREEGGTTPHNIFFRGATVSIFQ